MLKIHYQDSQEALNQEVGQLSTLIEGDSHIKEASSSAVSREMLADLKPDKDHFLVHAIMMGDGEYFGCFFEGAPVQTSEGFKPIEDVVEGDLVLTHKNRYRRVSNAFMAPYEGEAVKIKCQGLAEPEVSTARHPFKVVRQEAFSVKRRHPRPKPSGWTTAPLIDDLVESAEYVDARDVRRGDYMIVPVGSSEETHRLDMDLAPVAGFYLAEGCVHRQGLKRDKVPMSGTGKPRELVFSGCVGDEERFLDIEGYQSTGGRTASRNKSFTSDLGVRLRTVDRPLGELLVALVGDSAGQKRIHPAIFGQSEEWKLRFLAGYFDGDGCLHAEPKNPRYTNTLTCSTASANLAYDIQRLLASVGIRASSNLSFNKESNGCFGHGDLPIYSVSIGGSQSWKITQHCKQKVPKVDTRGKKTTSVVHTSGNYMLVPVGSVETFPVDTWKYNIEVEEDNTFVTRILGHNSNRNGDFWPEDWNIKRAHTFVTHGHMFREHRNRHPDEAIGQIKAAVHNPEMHRIEVALWGHKKKAAEEYELARSGKGLSFSMSARIPWDQCSCCSKKASRSSDYCHHLKHRMNQWVPEFEKFAYAINYSPTFFDASRVRRPADRIAHHLGIDLGEEALEKAASADGPAVFSDELARLEGVAIPDVGPLFDSLEKVALHRRLAEAEGFLGNLEKSAGDRADFAREVSRSGWGSRELTESEIEVLRGMRPESFFYQMAKRACVLPFASFAAYVTGDSVEKIRHDPGFVYASKKAIPSLFSGLEKKASNSGMEDLFDAGSLFTGEIDPGYSEECDRALDGLKSDLSIHPEAVMARRERGSEGVDKTASDAGVEPRHSDKYQVLSDAYAFYKISACKDMCSVFGENFVDDSKLILIINQQ